jgi:hypothetical protein|tara:strand:- start:1304 stop:1798 length:495 start_codon:yes stop_codon:yes gene_type:complete
MPELPKLPTPEEVNFYHLAADKDAGSGALHHTLGLGSSQASPGNHRHDGRDSRRIKYSDIEGAPTGSDGSAGSTVLSGIATLDFGLGRTFAETTLTGYSGITADSVILVAMRITATAEHTVDDLLADPIRVAVKDLVVGVGFTIDGRMDNAQASGTYKVHWLIS